MSSLLSKPSSLNRPDVPLDSLVPVMPGVSEDVLLAMLENSFDTSGNPIHEACALLSDIRTGCSVFVIVRREDGGLGCALISNPFVDVSEDIQVYETQVRPTILVPSLVASYIKPAALRLSLTGWHGMSGDQSRFQPVNGLLVLASLGRRVSLNAVNMAMLEICPEFTCLIGRLMAGEQIEGIPTAYTA